MPIVSSSGLFVYAKSLELVALFYEGLLGLSRVKSTDEIVVLASERLQFIVHAIPGEIAKTFDISVPPERREDAALKFFFTVESIAESRTLAAELGGEVLAEQWRGDGFIACNAVDPEGNIFQLRESAF